MVKENRLFRNKLNTSIKLKNPIDPFPQPVGFSGFSIVFVN